MASKGARAALFDTSLKRLQKAIDAVSETRGIDPLVIPTHDRDPEMLAGRQLEAMAVWVEALVSESKPPSDDPSPDDRDTEDAETDDAESITLTAMDSKSQSTKRPTPPRAASKKKDGE